MRFWKMEAQQVRVALLLLLCVLLYNAIQNRQRRMTNWDCEICADKSGYYIYLPIWFNYGTDTADMSHAVRAKTLQNFTYEGVAPGKSFTKFTNGIALMLSPFYFVGDTWYKHFSNKTPLPVSSEYLAFTNFGLAFYMALAFLALFVLIRRNYDWLTTLVTLLVIYLCTSLRYYVEDESLMSHAYSFCLFAYSWYLITIALEKRNRLALVGLALCGSLCVLIRPTNIIGIMALLVYSMHSRNWKEELKFLMQSLLFMIPIAFLVWIPQFMFWHETTGNWLLYSYGKEGFDRWKAPAIAKQWFAAQSGTFFYTPAMILFPIGLVGLLKQNLRKYSVLAISFVVCVYLFGSWWAKGFGDCNFGYRSFVEFLVIWSPAMAFIIDKLRSSKRWIALILCLFIIASLLYTTHIYSQFEGCFFGDDWDFAIFFKTYF